MMFIFGSFGQERRFPVGTYIPDPELLDDQRDAVITQLMMPIGRIRPWIEPAAGGAPQPADAPSDAESRLTEAARELHENMRIAEEAEDISSMKVQLQLRKILFKKKTVEVGGLKRQYCASRNETFLSIKKLLKIRRDFMAARGLHDAHPTPGGASQPADHRYLFTDEDRWQVMQEWKLRFHNRRDQVEQQKRDSWKPTGPPTDAQDLWGPNDKAVRYGKHSRFARHLQIAAGSKTMAELIIYTGRFDPEFLSQAQDTQEPRTPAGLLSAHRRKNLKRFAAQAKLNYRMTCLLRRKLDNGQVERRHLRPWQKKNLRQLQDGSLLRRTNDAVAAYGHGTLRREDGASLEIGGSTQGVTRFLLDGCAEPDVESFLAGS